jgi:hypothetical protein
VADFDLNDAFFQQRDFKTGLRIANARSRLAWKLSWRDPKPVLARLDALGHAARVRSIGAALGWSKPTVMKFVRLGLLKRKRRPRGSVGQRAIEIEVRSARWLVELCVRTLRNYPPLNGRENSRLRARLGALGPNGTYVALPPQLTVGELARFLRCAPITVLRMVEDGTLRARRRTPRRWEFLKKQLPWWCREKN